jgi:hypothetical protein
MRPAQTQRRDQTEYQDEEEIIIHSNAATGKKVV